MEYRFKLERYTSISSRHRCPNPLCGKPRVFTRYIDTQTNEYLHNTVGKCNRENKCRYHYTPKQYFADNPTDKGFQPKRAYRKTSSREVVKEHISYIDTYLVNKTYRNYDNNYFSQFLTRQFGGSSAAQLIDRYRIGTSKLWHGASIFWQTDYHQKVRTGKIMLYDPQSGKRVKSPFNHISWVHKRMGNSDFHLRQCLFGEHLLPHSSQPVALVESEKTAIIASLYFPQYTWLAAGSLHNLQADRCHVLAGRNITLFPDLKGYEAWSKQASKLTQIAASVQVSDLLERKASAAEREEGLDLADYLIGHPQQDLACCDNGADGSEWEYIQQWKEALERKRNKRGAWHEDIEELALFFETTTLPQHPIEIESGIKIMNCRHYVTRQLAVVRANEGKQTFRPYLDNLKQLKLYLEIHKVG